MGRGVCTKHLCNMAMMAATLMHGMIYGKNPIQNFFSGTSGPISLKF